MKSSKVQGREPKNSGQWCALSASPEQTAKRILRQINDPDLTKKTDLQLNEHWIQFAFINSKGKLNKTALRLPYTSQLQIDKEYGNIAKIKDQQSPTYSVFEKKKDNTISAAWQNLPKVGETVQIGFVSEEKSYEGKPYTQRTIRTIDADIENGKANHLAQNKSNSVAPTAFQDKSEQFWDMKAYKQCLWGFWLGCISNNQVPPKNWKDLVWQEFKDIEA